MTQNSRANQQDSDESAMGEAGLPKLTGVAFVRELFYVSRPMWALLITLAALSYLAANVAYECCAQAATLLALLVALALVIHSLCWRRGRRKGRLADRQLIRRYRYSVIRPWRWAPALRLRSSTGSVKHLCDTWTPGQNDELEKTRTPYIGPFLEKARQLDDGVALVQVHAFDAKTREITEQILVNFDFGEHAVTIEIGDSMPPRHRQALFDRITGRFEALEGVERIQGAE